jgi:hypothetical protein
MTRPFLFLGILLVAQPALIPARGDEIPPEARDILETAEEFQLLSLDPDKDSERDGFHGYKVLGMTRIKAGAPRAELVRALKKGAAEEEGFEAICFQPRHGLRVIRQGKTADFLICFECLNVAVFMGDKGDSFRTTKSPKPVFDKALKDAGIPLPDH